MGGNEREITVFGKDKIYECVYAWMSEWVSECLMSNEQLFRTSYNQWDENDVRFVVDEHLSYIVHSARVKPVLCDLSREQWYLIT